MRYGYILFLISGMILISNLSSVVNAAENEHGTVEAWIKFHDGEWQKPTTDTYHLKMYEPFQIKAIITSKVDGFIAPKIGGSGVTQAYEIIDGPSGYEQWLDNYDCPVGWNETFIWTVRPNGEWTEGTSGLNIRVGFNPDESIGEQTQIALGLINAYIEDEIWEGYVSENSEDTIDGTMDDNTGNNNNQSTPGFDSILLFLAIVCFLFLFVNKNKHCK